MKNTKKNKEIWVEKCTKTLIMAGRSKKTIINYKSAWNRFLNEYSEDTIINKLTNEDIAKYFYNSFVKNNRCADYYNLNVCAIRYLYSVCFDRELNRKVIPTTKLRKRVPSILKKDEFIKIFNDEHKLNHKCWLLLAFCSGLRVEEVATVKIENINAKEHKLKVLGKGNKERYTILPDVVIKFLRFYCKEEHITNKNGYLFKGTDGNEHVNEKTIINYFTKIQKEYNLGGNITFHSLRHSFATYYLTNNGNLLALQSMLGHKSLSTTTIYLHIAQNFNNLDGIKYV